jgi:hypothetical protein
LEPQAKKFIGFQKSRRSCRTVLRLLWVFFAGAGAASVGSAAATVSDVGCSDATGDGDSERAVAVDPGAGFVVAVTIGGGAARDGGSERAVSVGAGFVTMVIIGGGAPRDGGSERIASVAAGPADLTLVDAAGFDARRDAASERAGATAGGPESGTMRAGAWSYADTAWFFPRVGSTNQWKPTARTA